MLELTWSHPRVNTYWSHGPSHIFLNQNSQHLSQFLILFIFMLKYKILWIFKWQYNIVNNKIIKQYFFQRWYSFKQQQTINQVKQEFPLLVPTLVQHSPIDPVTQRSIYSTIRLVIPSSSFKPFQVQIQAQVKVR